MDAPSTPNLLYIFLYDLFDWLQIKLKGNQKPRMRRHCVGHPTLAEQVQRRMSEKSTGDSASRLFNIPWSRRCEPNQIVTSLFHMVSLRIKNGWVRRAWCLSNVVTLPINNAGREAIHRHSTEAAEGVSDGIWQTRVVNRPPLGWHFGSAFTLEEEMSVSVPLKALPVQTHFLPMAACQTSIWYLVLFSALSCCGCS